MSNKIYSCRLSVIALVLFCLVILFSINACKTASGAQPAGVGVFINPQSENVEIDGTFVATFSVSNYSELNNYQVVFDYNDSILKLNNVTFTSDNVFGGEAGVNYYPLDFPGQFQGYNVTGVRAGLDKNDTYVAVPGDNNVTLFQANFTVVGLGQSTIEIVTNTSGYASYTYLQDPQMRVYGGETDAFATSDCTVTGQVIGVQSVFANPYITPFERAALFVVLGTGAAALVYAWLMARRVLKEDPGTAKMQSVSNSIREGAVAYLNRQMEVVIPIAFVLAFALALTAYLSNLPFAVWLGRGIALLFGAACSLAIGQIGLRVIGTRANVRVAQQARAGSYQGALRVAYRAGTIAGMLADGLGLLGGTTIFILYSNFAPQVLLGFGFGGTLLAMFMRVGGGIYTKAADVGADLVGKVEQGIPEDDPRNAAAIADLVGDNVGDFSGMAEDVFESYEVTMVSAMILGLSVMAVDPAHSLKWIVFPLLVRAIGVFSSIIGTYAVGFWPTKGDAFRAMDISYDLSSAISTTAFFLIAVFYAHDLQLFAATATGILLAIAFNKYTGAFTQRGSGSVNDIVKASKSGPALVILSGIAIGYESTVWALGIIVMSILMAISIYSFTVPTQLASAIIVGAIIAAVIVGALLARRTKKIELGVFGAMAIIVFGISVSSFHVPSIPSTQTLFIMYSVALSGIGMLSHTGNNLAMDAFGPISDNASGIAEMCKEDFDTPEGQATLSDLDSTGNTTKAITKGIAIASAVIAAVSLFSAFIQSVGGGNFVLDIANPTVFIGILIGGALPFLFSSVLLRAVQRAASLIVDEVRKQFRIPGVMEGTKKPDYALVVRICTNAAQSELIDVALLAILMPIIIGFLMGELALGGFLAGIIVTGQLLAVFMANSGGAWDNAKKEIESEKSDPEANTGKGSARHKASIIGDTVGDPLKDTAGPALNPMIKVVNLVSLLIAPLLLTVASATGTTKTAVAVICLVFLGMVGWAVLRGKRKVPTMDKL